MAEVRHLQTVLELELQSRPRFYAISFA